ncbi:MAG: hypothetical protein OXC79_00335 [Candidatus Poribacteria bacterium]|nr:hypothetical protein [Candidatus Poribacteria bacterium]
MQEKEIRWKTSFLLFSIYLCLFIFLTGCDTGKTGIPDPPEPLLDLPPVSDKLVARIYFDATLSMQGFVVPDSTHYTRICPALESAIVSGWRDETVSFFRFGERVEPIDRNTYLQVGDENFYQTDIGIRTYIEKIIENEDPLVKPQMEGSNTLEGATEIDVNNMPEEGTEADSTENRLVVIVTDLFQDNGDINRLVPELKEKCIKKGVAVGLFGLRSQFDGTVYDIGIGEGSSLRYRSTPGNPETFRPFYLLVLGKHADIAHYFNRLIANGFSEAETIIFSQYLVSPLLSFDGAKIEKLENLIRDTIAEKPDSRLKEYRIRNRDRSSKISAKMKYELLPHAMPFDSNIFESPPKVEHNRYNSDERKEISQAAKECLGVTSTFAKNGNGDELIVDFELDSRVLPRRTVYLYKVALCPKIDTYQVPEWCSGWDMGTGRNGAKTLNLVNFVNGLTDIAVSEHQPKIAQFYFYVEKR